MCAHHIKFIRAILIGFVFIVFHHDTSAQAIAVSDTLKLSIEEAEKVFLDSNLSLVAQYYNIKSAEALVQQARRWDNPQLSTSQNIYTPREGFFKHQTIIDSTGAQVLQGELYIDIEQLIKTAGKRRKQVDITKTNVKLAEWQFNATLRSLKLELINNYFSIAQCQDLGALYDENIKYLTGLSSAMEKGVNSGNVSVKEALRVRSLLVAAHQNQVDNQKALEDAQSALKTLLRIKGNVFINTTTVLKTEGNCIPTLPIYSLLDTAFKYNTDYQTEVYNLQLQRQNLKLQKAMAYPDLTLGMSRDYQGSYTPQLWELNIGLPLPVWDLNKWNIKSSRHLVTAEEANYKQAQIKLENDVIDTYKKLLHSHSLFNQYEEKFYAAYQNIYNKEFDVFKNRLISLLDFLDYYNDFTNTKQAEIQHRFNLKMDMANLNDIVGIDIVNIKN